jgi:hypothetical protein
MFKTLIALTALSISSLYVWVQRVDVCEPYDRDLPVVLHLQCTSSASVSLA